MSACLRAGASKACAQPYQVASHSLNIWTATVPGQIPDRVRHLSLLQVLSAAGKAQSELQEHREAALQTRSPLHVHGAQGKQTRQMLFCLACVIQDFLELHVACQSTSCTLHGRHCCMHNAWLTWFTFSSEKQCVVCPTRMATFLQSASVLCLLKGLLDCLCSVAATPALPLSRNLSILAQNAAVGPLPFSRPQKNRNKGTTGVIDCLVTPGCLSASTPGRYVWQGQMHSLQGGGHGSCPCEPGPSNSLETGGEV